MNEPIIMRFTFGALKEIKTSIGIDLMGEDGEAKEKEIKPANFQRIAQAGIRWAAPGIDDAKAAELSQYVTIPEVTKALKESTVSTDADE
jgi:hypothetical protein